MRSDNVARKEIGIPLDRNNRNNHNDNFKELYDDFNNVVEKVSKEAFDQVIEGSKIDWSQMVESVSDLPSDADTGDAKGVKSDNKIYRFDGTDWIPIAEINLNPISEVDDRLTSQLAEKVSSQYETLSIYVPSNYPDLQSAVNEMSKKKTNNETIIDIIIESGYKLSSGVVIENGDYSNIRISSEDPVVYLSIIYEGDFLVCVNATAPLINVLIDMEDVGGKGLYIIEASRAKVGQGKGVINAGGTGLFVRSSFIDAAYSNFSGSNDRNAWFTRGAVGCVASADLSNCKGGETALYVSRSSAVDASSANISNANTTTSAAHCLRSKLNLLDADISNSRSHGIVAWQGSEVAARGVDASGAGRHAIYAGHSSTVSLMEGADVSRAGENGLYAMSKSSISGDNVNASECKHNAAYANGASEIDCPNIVANNCLRSGLVSEQGSTINAPNATINKPTNSGLLAFTGSTINASNSNVVDAGSHGVSSTGASTVNIPNTNVENSGKYGLTSSEASRINIRNGKVKNSMEYDIHQTHGGFIVASGCATTNGVNNPIKGDCSIDSFNTLSNRGVLFAK